MANRRRFLKHLGVASLGVAGCTDVARQRTTEEATKQERGTIEGTPSGSSIDSSIDSALVENFDTVLDAEAAGVDATGTSVVDEQIMELAGDDTLLLFPRGTYRVSGLGFEGFSNFGLYGDDATIKVDTRGRHTFMTFRRVSDIHVEGFSIDNTASNTAAWIDFKCVGGTNVIKDYAVEGFVDVNERTNGFTLMVEGEETSLTLENVDLSKGSINGAGVFVFPRIEFYDPDRRPGSLTFRDCVMKGWGKEGLYASAHSGPLRVIGGTYSNNAIGQVRVGGGNAPTRAVVRDVTVRVTSVPDYMPDGNRILRGIWLKEGDGALVENCDIEIRDVGRDQTQGGIIVNWQFGRATIRGCTLRTNVRRPAIRIEKPAEQYDQSQMRSLTSLPSAWDVTCTDVTIEGPSQNIEAISVSGRRGCEFRDVTIEKAGQASDGIRLVNVPSARIENSTIGVSRFPVVIEPAGQTESCAYRISDTVLESEDFSQVGSRLIQSEDGVFCFDDSVMSDVPSSDGEYFVLTRIGEASGDSTDVTYETLRHEQSGGADRRGEHVLYGRWFEEV